MYKFLKEPEKYFEVMIKDDVNLHYGKNARDMSVKMENAELVYEKTNHMFGIYNVGELHSSHNPTNEPRVTLSLCPTYSYIPKTNEFDNLVQWDDAMEIFKDYIVYE